MNQWRRWNEDAVSAEPAWRWLADALAMPALLATPARSLAEAAWPLPRLSNDVREKIAALLGADRVRVSNDERLRHAAGRAAPDVLRLRTGDLSQLPDAVLYPRNQEDVLELLRLCAEHDIAVTPFGAGRGDSMMAVCGNHAAIASCDLSGMAHLLSVDTMSGLAEVEAGITGAELNRQLGAHGMMLETAQTASLGGMIAEHRGEMSWLAGLRLATPQGLLESLPSQLVQGSQGILGIITAARLRIRPRMRASETRHYLFTDFAGGLTALREGRRQGLDFHARLGDGAETRFHQQLAQMGRRLDLSQRLGALYRLLRHFDSKASALAISFDGADGEMAAKTFDTIARRLGALAQKPGPQALPDWRESLLDRGVAVDVFHTHASWSKLPALYAGLRATLDQAMRAQAPRSGARGLVLARVGDVGHEGAGLRLTCIYPRALGKEVAQAGAIRQAGLDAIVARAPAMGEADKALLRAIKQTLDPKDILNPGKAAL